MTLADVMRAARADAYRESRRLREAAGPPPPPCRTDLTYRVIVTCPRCGGPLTHITGTPDRWCVEQRVVAECPACRDTHIVTVALQSARAAQRRLASIKTDTALYPRKEAS